MSQSPTGRLIVRVEGIRNLADDLTRELIRAKGGGLAAHAVAAAITRELDLVLRILKSDTPRSSAPANRRPQ
jgi:hypothetical protein